MVTPGLHVVFGAGPLGLAVARELAARGRRVRVVTRSGRGEVPAGVEAARGDATDPDRSRPLVEGAGVVYHAASPPYHRWPQEFPALTRGIIELAAASGARLVYADNLYAYGVAGRLTEDLPYRPRGPNGRVRAEMATAVLDAHRSGRLRATIGRAADFYGPFVLQSTVGERVFGAALAGKPAQVLGDPAQPHTYTFIEDFARGLITLGEREEALGEAWHVPSAETVPTRRFVELVFEAVGRPPRLSVAPKLGIAVLALVNPFLRSVKEVLYQYEQPFIVDHSKFERAFGAAPTPHREAIAATLDWYRRRTGPDARAGQ